MQDALKGWTPPDETTENLPVLSALVNEVLEEERANISREIHDVLSQQLTALKMDLSKIAGKHMNGIEVIAELNESMSLIDTIIDSVRKIAMDLRPAMLDDLGLMAALEWQCREFQSKTKISCIFKTEFNDFSFEKGFSNGVFRILQEALTNVKRHANASQVTVFIRREKDFFVLEVADNGKGILKQDSVKSLGILGMKERARLLGGALHIYREEKKGITVKAVLPLTAT